MENTELYNNIKGLLYQEHTGVNMDLIDYLTSHYIGINDINYSHFTQCDNDLSGMDFSAANMCGVPLCYINISNANLRHANLSGGMFYGCNFSGADLREANLYGADLRRANFLGANIDKANFTLANCFLARFGGNSNYATANFTNTNFWMDIAPKDMLGKGVREDLRLLVRRFVEKY